MEAQKIQLEQSRGQLEARLDRERESAKMIGGSVIDRVMKLLLE
jgi:hypothetical protein